MDMAWSLAMFNDVATRSPWRSYAPESGGGTSLGAAGASSWGSSTGRVGGRSCWLSEMGSLETSVSGRPSPSAISGFPFSFGFLGLATFLGLTFGITTNTLKFQNRRGRRQTLGTEPSRQRLDEQGPVKFKIGASTQPEAGFKILYFSQYGKGNLAVNSRTR